MNTDKCSAQGYKVHYFYYNYDYYYYNFIHTITIGPAECLQHRTTEASLVVEPAVLGVRS